MTDLHVVDGFDMPEQVALLRCAPDPELMEPVREGRHPRKASGGLWTSTYLGAEDISAWWLWASGSMPAMVSDHADFSISPAEGLRVIVVDSVEDGWALFEAYGCTLWFVWPRGSGLIEQARREVSPSAVG